MAQKAGPGGATAAARTLRDLLQRHPGDSDARVTLGALENDIDLDGRPEVIDLHASGFLTIRLATGQEVLRVPVNPLNAPVPNRAEVVDLGMAYPGVIVHSIQVTWAYQYDAASGRLTPLGSHGGFGRWDWGTRALHVSSVEKGVGSSPTLSAYAI